jgi:hypothetical protein
MVAKDDPSSANTAEHDEFARAAQDARPGLLVEFWDFLKHNKKWWLLPMLVVFVLAALLIFLASNPATAPFIYPMF